MAVASAYLSHPQPMLLICGSHERSLMWQSKLQIAGVPESAIRELPSGVSSLFEDASPESVALSDRIGAIRFLLSHPAPIILTTPGAALERTLPQETYETCFRRLEPGDQVDLEELRGILLRLGYEPAEPVRQPGQFSRRGGIFDIFAAGHEQPVRLDFFDESLESMRYFDSNSQRSVGKLEVLEIGPSRETLYPEAAEMEAFLEMIQRTLELECAGLGEEKAEQLREAVTGDLRSLGARRFFDRLDLYRPLIHPDSPCALDLLPQSGVVVFDDPFELESIANRAEDDLKEALMARAARGEILQSAANDYMLPTEHLGSQANVLSLLQVGDSPDWMRISSRRESNVLSLEPYRGQAAHLTQSLQNWIEAGFHIAISTDQPNRAASMLEQIALFPRNIDEVAEGDELPAGLFLIQGNLAGGFLAPDSKIAFLTDQELFGVGRLKLPQRKFNEGAPITTVLDLKDGDYVVHINFGIGVFRGLVTRNVGGIEKEYLFLQYEPPDKLYVPADQLDRVQKYLNPGDAQPKLNRLTGGAWQKTVRKAREDAREFARDLTRLYAQRKAVQRTPFGPDSPWMAEMEATFPWVETRSQMTAIRDAKRDLMNDYPMDRLICGDVGFGKTEVAIRAAFKVAEAGRQVVVLCPTTILSEQHFRNFQERLAPFPVRLDIINRFRTSAERAAIERNIEQGEVDIVVGTHALLGHELKFKDLGLVIIDEEHKFGVKQKEMLKKLRVNVDVLTMSATPIPRTLSMALMDIREMSLISDPPPGRLPVRTYVRSASNEVIRDAILRELARGGQVYYVYNRVQGIQHIHEDLKRLVPHAKIVVGHGQMNEKELEPVMVAFIKGEADVLLSTTIVESGLDIPNANTLIVEDADRMGLAQLYQLRGRVGRSDRQAYAYFLYSGGKTLTEAAHARLNSLQEFSTLGSGYNLAFRDLQIRGAGELLGSKQHGTMATVGFELYTQLIAEEIAFLKAHADGMGTDREYRDPLDGLEPLPTIDLPTNARIPEAYIEDQAQRLYYYQALMSSRSEEALTSIEGELADRYGKLPDEVRRAVWVMRLRIQSHRMKIEKIDGNGGRLAVSFYESAELPPRLWVLLQRRYKDCYFARNVFYWPYTGGPVAACQQMLESIQTSLDEIEQSRMATN